MTDKALVLSCLVHLSLKNWQWWQSEHTSNGRPGFEELACEEEGQKPSVRGYLQTSGLSLLVLISRDLILCEEMQKQEAVAMVKCGGSWT